MSGLLRCSVCGGTLARNGCRGYSYFQCWKYTKGFHKGSSAIRIEEAEKAVINYFDEILAGADFSYVRKSQSTIDNTAAIEQLQRELSRLSVKEDRIRDAYENGIDTLEEYKDNKMRLADSRHRLERELQNLQSVKELPIDREKILEEIRSVNDVLKDPDVGYEEKGNLIRTIVEQIVYDKKTGKMYFDIIVS